MESNEQKVAILNIIREKKEILFGSFSATLTFNDKIKQWTNIWEYGKAIGLITKPSHDWKYLRDKMFGQWKMRTLKKKANRNQTGKGGGNDAKITTMDEIILDIIGKDSPIISGIPGVEESWGVPILAVKNHGEEDLTFDSDLKPDSHERAVVLVSSQGSTLTKELKMQNIIKGKAEKSNPGSVLGLKRKRVSLQNDILELDKRKKALELHELEQKLGMDSNEILASYNFLAKK